MMNAKNQQDIATQNETEKTENPAGTTRRERRKIKKREAEQAAQENEDVKKSRWVQIRLIPIWLRIILVLLLLAAFTVIGLYVGYSVVGDGAPGDVLKKETWLHITDIISGKE